VIKPIIKPIIQIQILNKKYLYKYIGPDKIPHINMQKYSNIEIKHKHGKKQFVRCLFINTKVTKAFVYIKKENAFTKINNVYPKKK